MPVFSVLFGRITGNLIPDKKDDDEIKDQATNNSLLMLCVGVIAFLFASLGVSLWRYVGSKITETLKKMYF